MQRYGSPSKSPSAKHDQDEYFSSVTSKGQTTIPAEIGREAGIKPGDKVRFSIANGIISIEKAQKIDHVWNASQSQMMEEWNHPDEDVYND